jgi:MFS family permease
VSREARVIGLLSAAQALQSSAGVLIMTIGGLAGLRLAPESALATLPIAMVSLGNAITTIPASLFMSRYGRRPGFVIGALCGAVGGGLAAYAIVSADFVLLCIATTIFGGYQGFGGFYRFAAAEAAGPSRRGRAISLVLAGGVVAAVAGPHLGALTRNAIGGAPYAGSFVVVMTLGLVAAAVLGSTRLGLPAKAAAGDEPARPLARIIAQPKFLAALTGAAIGYGVMVLVMTATPLSMAAHHHGVEASAFVIQWHVLGMFVPSFFSGWLVERFGVTRMMLTGVVLLTSHVMVALSGVAYLNFLSGLVLLGVGWNFLYVGGSTLLTETYRPSERGRVQALNDFIIVGVTAAASFSAGALTEIFGWRGLNLAALPMLAFAAAVVAWAAIVGRPRAPREVRSD